MVKIWKKHKLRKQTTDPFYTLASQLSGHTHHVTCLYVSQEWNLILSGSHDKKCIIWDLNRMRFIRALSGHKGSVTCVTISQVTGDILTVSVDDTLHNNNNNNNKFELCLWGINGDLWARVPSEHKILCVAFTSGIEGCQRNVIIGGKKKKFIFFFLNIFFFFFF